MMENMYTRELFTKKKLLLKKKKNTKLIKTSKGKKSDKVNV